MTANISTLEQDTALCSVDCSGKASGSRDPCPPASSPSWPPEDGAQQPLAGPASDSGIDGGNAVPQLKGQGPGDLLELGRDVWGFIFDKLSPTELARVATVSKAWRDAGDERAAKRRAAAVARVTAPDHVPDDELTTPQRVLRAMRRHLLGQDAFTGEPVHGPPNGEYVRRNKCILPKTESEVDLLQLAESRHASHMWVLMVCNSSRRFGPAAMWVKWGTPVSPDDPYNVSTPIAVRFLMRPRSSEESEWMQGLLLCLSDGSLGDPCPTGSREITSLSLRGPLARCTFLRIAWGAHYPYASKDSVLLPMIHHMDHLDSRVLGKIAQLAWGEYK